LYPSSPLLSSSQPLLPSSQPFTCVPTVIDEPGIKPPRRPSIVSHASPLSTPASLPRQALPPTSAPSARCQHVNSGDATPCVQRVFMTHPLPRVCLGSSLKPPCFFPQSHLTFAFAVDGSLSSLKLGDGSPLSVSARPVSEIKLLTS
jgi:hypothetical protein